MATHPRADGATVVHSVYHGRASFPALFAVQKKAPAVQDGKVKSVAGSEVGLAVSAKKTVEVPFGSGPGGSQEPASTNQCSLLGHPPA